MDLYKIICPYCDFPNITGEYGEGYQAVVCRQCGQPFLNLTKMVPSFTSLRVVGFVDSLQRFSTLDEIEEDAKYYAKHPEELDAIECNDCIEYNEAEQKPTSCEQKQDFCKQNTGENEQNSQSENKPREGHYWPSEKDVLICAHCRKGYEDHGITDGVCPTCFLDEDSVKGLSEASDNKEGQSDNTILQSSNEFQLLSNNTHVSYRCDGDYIDLKYNGASNTRTSWADIFTLVEELKESDNISPSIKQLLGDKVGAIAVRAASINAFVRAVKAGAIPEVPAPEEDDSDYKPLLSGIVNTRCNYDGGKIGEM